MESKDKDKDEKDYLYRLDVNANRYPILYALYFSMYFMASLLGFGYALYFTIPWMYSTPTKTLQNHTVLQLHAITGFMGMISGPIYFLLLLYYSRGIGYKILRVFYSLVYNIVQLIVFGTVAGLYPRSTISQKHGIPFTILFVGWALYLFITWIISWGIYIVSYHSRMSHRKNSFRAISVNAEFRNVSMFLYGGYLIAMMQIKTQSVLCIVSYLMLVILLACNELFLYTLNHDPDEKDANHEEIDVELPKEKPKQKQEPPKETPKEAPVKKPISKAPIQKSDSKAKSPATTKKNYKKASKKEESYEYSYYSDSSEPKKTPKKTNKSMFSFFKK